jgi:hypothetical protein
MKKFALGLFLILLVSGCTMPFDLGGIIPGMEGSKVNKTEASPDLIVIQDINVIPTPPISAGDEFSVSFQMKNQDEINELKGVGYILFDYGLCKPLSSGTEGIIQHFSPLATEFKEWSFAAPTNNEIAYLPNKCPIRFKINYTFDSTSQIDVNVISKDRLTQLQRAGNPPSFTPSLSVGSGPVKIYLSFGTSLPVRNESSLPIFITVEDKGVGLLREIPGGSDKSLILKVPSTFTKASCDKFDDGVVDPSDSNYIIYKNKDAIQIIKKTSPQIKCTFKTPTSANINNLEKTYFITARLQYDYEISGETIVNIKPT